jgi:hypothetical protein
MDIINNRLGTIDQANALLQEAGYHTPFFIQENPDGTEIRLMDRHQTGEAAQFFEMDFAFEDRQVLLNMCRAYLLTVPVNHTVHNNIDKKDLEDRMQQINWAHDYNGDYFERVDAATRDKFYPLVKSIYDDLNQLAQADADPEGIVLADQLIIKYWSWTPENDRSLYLEAAKEKYMVHMDYLHIPTLREAYADLSIIQQQKQEDMNIGINFYELKTQLADLGFAEAELVNQLRTAILGGKGMFTLESAKHTPNETTQFFFNMVPASDRYVSLESYDSSISPGTGALLTIMEQRRDQSFDPDVPAAEAIQLLQSRMKHPEVDADIAFTPMSRKDVRTSLGQIVNQQQTIINQINTSNMNTQNLDFLKNSLLNLGFGDKLNTEMEKQIEDRAPEFTLTAQHEFNQKKIDYTLNFKAGDNHEMYFFNSYDAALSKGKNEQLNQTFYIHKGNGVTAKEAFNLMEGRAVNKQLFNKDGEKYNAWLVLDNEKLTDKGNKEIKKFTENYGYDLEQTLSGKGIKEMNDPKTKEDLFRSLKKGNSQQVTVERDNKEQKYFISANPQYKTVDVLDHQMKKVKREELLHSPQNQSTNQKQTQQQKEDLPEKKHQQRKRKTV